MARTYSHPPTIFIQSHEPVISINDKKKPVFYWGVQDRIEKMPRGGKTAMDVCKWLEGLMESKSDQQQPNSVYIFFISLVSNQGQQNGASINALRHTRSSSLVRVGIETYCQIRHGQCVFHRLIVMPRELEGAMKLICFRVPNPFKNPSGLQTNRVVVKVIPWSDRGEHFAVSNK